MKKLLVPTDFSETSGAAFEFAIQISKKENLPITAIHVCDLPFIFETDVAEEIIDNALGSALQQMEEFTDKHNEDGLHIQRVVEVGDLVDTIEKYRSDAHYDLIVMGTHGATGLKEIFIGSNAEQVIRRATCPVLTIPGPQKIGKLKKLLVPLDIEDLSEGFLHHLKEVSAFFRSQLHFLYVNTPATQVNKEQFFKELNDVLIHRNFKNYEIHSGRDFTIEAGILHVADHIKADMICLSTHGTDGLAHILAGSVAEDIANHAKIPVWAYNRKMEENFKEVDNLALSL